MNKKDPIFQFRVRDISLSGMGILVNEGSKALKYLEVGQVLLMKYNLGNNDNIPINPCIKFVDMLSLSRYIE